MKGKRERGGEKLAFPWLKEGEKKSATSPNSTENFRHERNAPSIKEGMASRP